MVVVSCRGTCPSPTAITIGVSSPLTGRYIDKLIALNISTGKSQKYKQKEAIVKSCVVCIIEPYLQGGECKLQAITGWGHCDNTGSLDGSEGPESPDSRVPVPIPKAA